MKNELRWEEIVKQVNRRGYVSVNELSMLCDASIITIRRDLDHLERGNRLMRTHGGAASLQALTSLEPDQNGERPAEKPGEKKKKTMIIDWVDALITSDSPAGILPAGIRSARTPIIGESMLLAEAQTSVEVDNYKAGCELGRWAGAYAREHWSGRAVILDLTYHRPNTRDRSRGFVEGARSVLPEAELRLSINAQSREDMAYQLARDALAIHPDINIIFAINDTSALGAYRACQDLGIAADRLIILPFGVEGPTMLGLIEKKKWCVAGLCMFPQIVAVVCAEAAITACNREELPARLTTPHCIITAENIEQYYRKTAEGWALRWEEMPCRSQLPLPVSFSQPNKKRRLPERIGFLYTYTDHEWYKQLLKTMNDYCGRLGIRLEVLDLAKTQKDELELRRQEIAQRAAEEVRPGDTIFIDGGVLSRELAALLAGRDDLTVITNSLDVIEALCERPAITLISTGGALRRSNQVFVGPTAEATLKELHIDKLFLMVSGVSSAVGLTHTNISEVTIKQQMIRSTREVILLADHNCFQEQALVQVAPISVVHKLITDGALPASTRLELGAQGIQVILATM